MEKCDPCESRGHAGPHRTGRVTWGGCLARTGWREEQALTPCPRMVDTVVESPHHPTLLVTLGRSFSPAHQERGQSMRPHSVGFFRESEPHGTHSVHPGAWHRLRNLAPLPSDRQPPSTARFYQAPAQSYLEVVTHPAPRPGVL